MAWAGTRSRAPINMAFGATRAEGGDEKLDIVVNRIYSIH
jgi:hypothetical protein